jgi:hypothetical protein
VSDEGRNDLGMSIKSALDCAARIVEQWGTTSEVFTGRWLDLRDALIGVGIDAHADDEAVRELLQAAVPEGIRVRVRLVSAERVRLHQLQVHVSYYLDDQGFWSRYAVALGVDQLERHVEVGLLPSTPDIVAAQILEQFPADVVLDRNASHATAL